MSLRIDNLTHLYGKWFKHQPLSTNECCYLDPKMGLKSMDVVDKHKITDQVSDPSFASLY